MDEVGAVVIGLGVMGGHHARVYHELGVLAGVCDIDLEKARSIGKRYRVPYTNKLEEVFNSRGNKKLIASIAVPTPFHVEVTTKCLNIGVHVLLEKPMAPTVEEAIKLHTLAKEKNLHLGVGYIETFNPAFQMVKELTTKGTFGKITSVNIKRVGGVPRSADNVVLDLMTHDFCLLINLLNMEPSTIAVHQHKAPDGIVDSAQALLDFGDTSASCEANWVSPVKIRTMTVTGDKGLCEIDLIKQKVTRIETPDLITIHQLQSEPLKEELQGFINVVQGKQGLIIDSDVGCKVLNVTLCAVQQGDSNGLG
jgi:UDP-N-acetylglucosamine 3-dehydrogenase